MVGMATLQRNYMHDMGSGICYFGTGTDGSAVAENNYVTNMRSYGESHNEAGTVRDFVKNAGDTRTLKWIGNRLDIASGNVTAGLFLQPTWSDIYNVWVINNWISGGGYNLYSSGGQTGAHIGNAHPVNNRFTSTGWGPAVVDGVEGWFEWSENYATMLPTPMEKVRSYRSRKEGIIGEIHGSIRPQNARRRSRL
jgi:hypothetical protein